MRNCPAQSPGWRAGPSIGRGRPFSIRAGFCLPACSVSLKKKGALVASFHPGQAFPSKKTRPSHFRGISFGLEETGKRLPSPETWSASWEAERSLSGGSCRYTTRPSASPNFLVVLLDAAAELMSQAELRIAPGRPAILLNFTQRKKLTQQEG
jgi:hypothetical protein